MYKTGQQSYEITKNDNTVFDSEADRREFIIKYYENLYKLPPTQMNNLNGCIEEFLGPDITASPMVTGMKPRHN